MRRSRTVDEAEFEAALGAALADPPLDLRQGAVRQAPAVEARPRPAAPRRACSRSRWRCSACWCRSRRSCATPSPPTGWRRRRPRSPPRRPPARATSGPASAPLASHPVRSGPLDPQCRADPARLSPRRQPGRDGRGRQPGDAGRLSPRDRGGRRSRSRAAPRRAAARGRPPSWCCGRHERKPHPLVAGAQPARAAAARHDVRPGRRCVLVWLLVVRPLVRRARRRQGRHDAAVVALAEARARSAARAGKRCRAPAPAAAGRQPDRPRRRTRPASPTRGWRAGAGAGERRDRRGAAAGPVRLGGAARAAGPGRRAAAGPGQSRPHAVRRNRRSGRGAADADPPRHAAQRLLPRRLGLRAGRPAAAAAGARLVRARRAGPRRARGDGQLWLGALKEAQFGAVPLGDVSARLNILPLLLGRARLSLSRDEARRARSTAR